MNKIFAQFMSDKKVIAFCPPNHERSIANSLQKQFGGEWILVENLKVNEAIIFSDQLIYRGFEVDKENYCNSIVKI